jgi:hypothetical protein
MNERLAVLSALVDREPVDPALVDAALAEPEGRSQLVDFLRVRQRLAASLESDALPRLRLPPDSPTRRWVARVAIVLLPLMLGTVAGAWMAERRELSPPEPDRVIKFVRGVDWK